MHQTKNKSTNEMKKYSDLISCDIAILFREWENTEIVDVF